MSSLEVAAPEFPASGWIFSSDISAEKQEEIQGLIAAHGLSSGVTASADAAARAADADAAFLKLMAAHPTAKIVGGPTAMPERRPDEDLAPMWQPANAEEAAAAEAAFDALVQQTPGATEIAPGVFALAPGAGP
ncbi:hypothetical protein M885DRAFT_519439 [Pelagophyceae sp. CCMP2097]|nr:hypothetical protein M885DRAFT_519439 [Pelagophyceae sp. CCMP2097]